MITTRSFTYSLLFCLALLANLAYAEQKPFTPVGGWEYRWGDSPSSIGGKLDWLYKLDSDKSWRPIDKPSDIPIIPGKKDLWIRLHLGNRNETNSAIFVNRIEKIFEVYLDTNKIYSFGKFTSDDKIPMMGFAWHLIKLPENSNGKTLYFRIRSDCKYIGVYSEIRFGSEESFLSEIIKTNLSKTILGIIFIFAGLVFSIILLFIGKIKPYLGIIIFMTTSGIWTLANSNLTQIFFNAPKVIYYADHLALFASAVGFFMLVVEIIDPKYKRIFTAIYQLLIGYFLVVLFLDITGISDNIDTVAPFLIFTTITVFVLIYFIFLSAKKGNDEAKILLIALAVYAVFVLADIANYFKNVVINLDTYEMQFAHYGGFAFLVFIAWIFIARYVEMNKQMIDAQMNERVRIAQDIHDEVGPRLTEIRMVSESIKSNTCLTVDEQKKLEELSEASDKVISTFSEIIWALNPTNDTLEEFASYLTQNAINFLQKADIRCRIDIPPLFPNKKISYEVRRNIIMAVKESLNNIVKHADASLVTMQLTVTKNDLLVLIVDDGCGFDINNTRKYGNGLKNIERRIKSVNGKYSVETRIDIGTRTKMEVPLQINTAFTQTGYFPNDI
ncbi:MAG: sensor histidine kinase [Ignavibacteria bacterium]|nr:sensor histidine kinase [Ignavibacteria bacterium]